MDKKHEGRHIGAFFIEWKDIDAPLGQGAFSKVYRCSKPPETEKRYAAKEIMRQSSYRTQLEHEIEVSQEICRKRPKNVIQIEDVIEEVDNVYIIMNLCNRETIEHYYYFHPLPTIEEVQNLFKGIVTGVANLHKIDIAHRDLKLDNIFVHEEPEGKLTPYIGDLGFAKVWGGEKNEGTKFLDVRDQRPPMPGTILGTPVTMAPEILQQDEYTMKVDIWSLGCILYKLCFGLYPFERDGQPLLAIRNKFYTVPECILTSIDCLQLLERCLQQNPRYRPSAEELLECPFVTTEWKQQNLVFLHKAITLDNTCLQISSQRTKSILGDAEVIPLSKKP